MKNTTMTTVLHGVAQQVDTVERAEHSASAAAVAAWRSACAEVEASARSLNNASSNRRPALTPEVRRKIAVCVGEGALAKARFEERRTRIEAAGTLDLEEQRLGDPLAVACALAPLRDDVEALVGEIERHEAAVEGARKALNTRLALARDAQAKVAARRAEAGLPPPPRIPTERAPAPGAFATARDYLRDFDDQMTSDQRALEALAEKLRRVTSQERDLRALAEKAQRQAEAERRVASEANERIRQARKVAQAKDAAKAAERARSRAMGAEERQRERDELAAADRMREGAVDEKEAGL